MSEDGDPAMRAEPIVQRVDEAMLGESSAGDTVLIIPAGEQVAAEETVTVDKVETGSESESRAEASGASSHSPAAGVVIKRVVQAPAVEQKPLPVQLHLPQTLQQSILQQQQVAAGDFQMAGVLSAIASHLSKGKKLTVEEQLRQLEAAQSGNSDGSPLIVTIAASGAVSPYVPSSSQDVTVSSMENVTAEQVIQTVSGDLTFPLAKKPRVDVTDSSQEPKDSFCIQAESLTPGTVLQTENGIFHVTEVTTVDDEKPSSALSEIYGPCPICGDRISGKQFGPRTFMFLFVACRGKRQ